MTRQSKGNQSLTFCKMTLFVRNNPALDEALALNQMVHLSGETRQRTEYHKQAPMALSRQRVHRLKESHCGINKITDCPSPLTTRRCHRWMARLKEQKDILGRILTDHQPAHRIPPLTYGLSNRQLLQIREKLFGNGSMKRVMTFHDIQGIKGLWKDVQRLPALRLQTI